MTTAHGGQDGRVSYRPIQFGGASSALSGVFHPAAEPRRATGVVISNPIGDNDVRAHRALRHLALALADAGFAALRFDFRGTGDSAGSERDPGCADGWRVDVLVAARELRERSGVERVVAVGLRLGATLAAVAASRATNGGGIDGLVLWHPFLNGAAFVDDATKRHRMHELLEPESVAAIPAGWTSGGTEVLGFLLTPETVASLEALDLLALRSPPAPHTIVIGALNAAADDRLVKHLRSLGAVVHYRHMPGHKFLLQAPHRSEVPRPVLDEIVRALAAQYPDMSTRPASAAVESPRRDEEPLVFGRRDALFGVLARPASDQAEARRPAIVMASAGANHRIGPHRIYVALARRWASLGFWVLRFDLSGIGDSPAAPGCTENATHPRDGVSDLGEAMDALTAKTGAQSFVLFGHFSGADLAYQAAMRDSRVRGVMMLNPRTFGVNDPATIETYKNARYYQQSFLRPASWKKALRGEVNLRRAASLVLPKFIDLARRRAQALLASSKDGGRQDDVPTNLRRLAERGVDTFLLASERDPGVDFLDVRQGEAMRALAGVRGFRRYDFVGVDHSFTSLYAQERLFDVLTEHLSTRHAG
jgi:alpha-beta hydrolase superfamily lysophospholipase